MGKDFRQVLQEICVKGIFDEADGTDCTFNVEYEVLIRRQVHDVVLKKARLMSM